MNKHLNNVQLLEVQKRILNTIGVVTLTLGSQPRQRLAKVQAKNEAWESHFMLPRV